MVRVRVIREKNVTQYDFYEHNLKWQVINTTRYVTSKSKCRKK